MEKQKVNTGENPEQNAAFVSSDEFGWGDLNLDDAVEFPEAVWSDSIEEASEVKNNSEGVEEEAVTEESFGSVERGAESEKAEFGPFKVVEADAEKTDPKNVMKRKVVVAMSYGPEAFTVDSFEDFRKNEEAEKVAKENLRELGSASEEAFYKKQKELVENVETPFERLGAEEVYESLKDKKEALRLIFSRVPEAWQDMPEASGEPDAEGQKRITLVALKAFMEKYPSVVDSRTAEREYVDEVHEGASAEEFEEYADENYKEIDDMNKILYGPQEEILATAEGLREQMQNVVQEKATTKKAGMNKEAEQRSASESKEKSSEANAESEKTGGSIASRMPGYYYGGAYNVGRKVSSVVTPKNTGGNVHVTVLDKKEEEAVEEPKEETGEIDELEEELAVIEDGNEKKETENAEVEEAEVVEEETKTEESAEKKEAAQEKHAIKLESLVEMPEDKAEEFVRNYGNGEVLGSNWVSPVNGMSYGLSTNLLFNAGIKPALSGEAILEGDQKINCSLSKAFELGNGMVGFMVFIEGVKEEK